MNTDEKLKSKVTDEEKRAALEPLRAACINYMMWAHERGGGDWNKQKGMMSGRRRLIVGGDEARLFDLVGREVVL